MIEREKHACAVGVDRRAVLKGTLAASFALATLSSIARAAVAGKSDPIRDMVVVNTLGALFDIEAPLTPEQEQQRLAVSMFTFPEAITARSLADARAAGLTAVTITLGHVFGSIDPYEHTVDEMSRWRRILDAHPQELIHVRSAADILRAKSEGKIGAILGFQNSTMLGDKAERVDTFADLGARVFQLTYNKETPLGDGALAANSRGLTRFGHEVLARMNHRRVIADLSHSGRQICLDAIAASVRPITISHTGCRALVDSPRNKTDEELRLVAEKGGYVGIFFMPFLRAKGTAQPADLLAHIEHALKICGEDHVGIGTDGTVSPIRNMEAYMARQSRWVASRARDGVAAPGEGDNAPFFVEGLNDTDQFRNLATMLSKRGHAWTRIEKILGRNYVRVAGEIWGA